MLKMIILYYIIFPLHFSYLENTKEVLRTHYNNLTNQTHFALLDLLIIPFIHNVTSNHTEWAYKRDNIWSKKSRNNSVAKDIKESLLRTASRKVLASATELVDNNKVVFRVINGQEAGFGSIPWQIAVVKQQGSSPIFTAFCGGSLVGPNKVISAAHCFETEKLSDCYRGELKHSDFKRTYFVAGSISTTLSQKWRDIESSTTYEQFRKPSFGSYPKMYRFPRHDIAVVHTSRPFYFNQYVAPIPFASVRKEYSGECLASGFGRIDNYNPSAVLLWAFIEPLPSRVCNAIHRKDMSRFICTSDAISDVHKGDSGGPLVCLNTGDPKEGKDGILVGVVSGKTLGKRSSAFFTRVSAYSALVNRSRKTLSSFTFAVMALIINYAILLF